MFELSRNRMVKKSQNVKRDVVDAWKRYFVGQDINIYNILIAFIIVHLLCLPKPSFLARVSFIKEIIDFNHNGNGTVYLAG